jgi:hypothetical protein
VAQSSSWVYLNHLQKRGFVRQATRPRNGHAYVDSNGSGMHHPNPGSADCNCRANSFLCFRFILPAAIFVPPPLKMDQAQPGCGGFKNLSNGV